MHLAKLDLSSENYVTEGQTPKSIAGTPRDPAQSELDNALKHSYLPRESITPRTEHDNSTAVFHLSTSSSMHDNKLQTTSSSNNSNISAPLNTISISSPQNIPSSPLTSLSLVASHQPRIQTNPKTVKTNCCCCFW